MSSKIKKLLNILPLMVYLPSVLVNRGSKPATAPRKMTQTVSLISNSIQGSQILNVAITFEILVMQSLQEKL